MARKSETSRSKVKDEGVRRDFAAGRWTVSKGQGESVAVKPSTDSEVTVKTETAQGAPKPPRPLHPIHAAAGILADDPQFEELQEQIRKNRRELDGE